MTKPKLRNMQASDKNAIRPLVGFLSTTSPRQDSIWTTSHENRERMSHAHLPCVVNFGGGFVFVRKQIKQRELSNMP